MLIFRAYVAYSDHRWTNKISFVNKQLLFVKKKQNTESRIMSLKSKREKIKPLKRKKRTYIIEIT